MESLEVRFLENINNDFNKIFKFNSLDVAIVNNKNEFIVTIQNTNNVEADMVAVFYRIYEILYFLCGKFFEIEYIRSIKYNGKIIERYPIHNIYKFQKSSDYVIGINFKEIIEQVNFEDILLKWVDCRNKLSTQINSYLLVTTKNILEIGYYEIAMSLLLQSMEGFVTGCLKNNLLYQDKTISINVNNDFKSKNCNELNYNDIKKIQYADKLKLMLERYKGSILEKECKKKQKCLILNTYNEVINKCNNTRNYISHMDYDNKRHIFELKEMKYYLEKMILIYRMNILNLLNIVDENINDSINSLVKNINENMFKDNYYNNRKKCENCKHKNKCNFEDIKVLNLEELIKKTGDL